METFTFHISAAKFKMLVCILISVLCAHCVLVSLFHQKTLVVGAYHLPQSRLLVLLSLLLVWASLGSLFPFFLYIPSFLLSFLPFVINPRVKVKQIKFEKRIKTII